MLTERAERLNIVRYGVVSKIPSDDLPQPLPLLGKMVVHAQSQLFLDFLELGLHAIPPGLPLNLEFALARFAADKREAQEVDSVRFSEPFASTISRCKVELTRFCGHLLS